MTNSSSILDFQLALDAVNGNANLARDLLTTLISQLDDYQIKITDFHHADDRKQLQDTIHKINGAMRYVGAPMLAEKVASLDGQIEAISADLLAPQISEVLVEINNIIELGRYPE